MLGVVVVLVGVAGTVGRDPAARVVALAVVALGAGPVGVRDTVGSRMGSPLGVVRLAEDLLWG